MFKRGRNHRNQSRQLSKGLSQLDLCTCPQCHYAVPHKQGIPCVSLSCPQCHIPLVRQKTSEQRLRQNPPQNRSKNSVFPIVDTSLCVACGACVKICPNNAIVLEDGKAKINIEKCKNCRACIKVCKKNAIT